MEGNLATSIKITMHKPFDQQLYVYGLMYLHICKMKAIQGYLVNNCK